MMFFEDAGDGVDGAVWGGSLDRKVVMSPMIAEEEENPTRLQALR
jgi:hypothetical protein